MLRKLRNLMVLAGLARTGKKAWDRRNAARRAGASRPSASTRRFI